MFFDFRRMYLSFLSHFVKSAVCGVEFLNSATARQFFYYGSIGLLTNLSSYGLYLLMTHLGVSPKQSMSVMYILSVIFSFFANRKFTFQHDGHIGKSSVRFFLVYLFGYLLNLLMLVVLVDWMDFPHQIVQAIAIIVVAVFLFALSKVYVFRPTQTKEGAIGS